MLYLSNILAVVGTKEKGVFSNKRITFWDTNKDVASVDLSLMSNVLAIRLNKTRLMNSLCNSFRLVVFIKDAIQIYDLELREINKIPLINSLGITIATITNLI